MAAFEITGPSIVCAGNLNTFGIDGDEGSNYDWVFDNAAQVDGEPNLEAQVLWEEIGEYLIRVINESEQEAEFIIRVVAIPNPQVIVQTVVHENFVHSCFAHNIYDFTSLIWTVQNGEIISGQGTPQITYSKLEQFDAWAGVCDSYGNIRIRWL
jgi:hypothetical protein